MNWKIFALLESSLSVLLSVLAVVYMAFVLATGQATALVTWLAIGGIVLSLALTLVAHGQLVGAFRRKPNGLRPEPKPGSMAIPILVLAVLGICAVVPLLAGGDAWVDFLRTYLTYSMVAPAGLAIISRLLVVLLCRRASDVPLR
ncbi:MAG TPA: hypothetical protein VMW65_01620 [Chloroflexota bacterium]|nr:hypothetical protein [Chloroflexota bacterium]